MAYKAFQDNLLNVFNIQEADEADKEKFLKLFEELSSQLTLDCILKNLSAEDGKTFLDLLEKDASGDEAMTFAKSHIPTLDEIVTKRIKEEVDIIDTASK